MYRARARAHEEAKRASLDVTRGGSDGKTFNVTSRYARKFKDAPRARTPCRRAHPLAGQMRRAGGAGDIDIAGTIMRVTLQSYDSRARYRTQCALFPVPSVLPLAALSVYIDATSLNLEPIAASSTLSPAAREKEATRCAVQRRREPLMLTTSPNRARVLLRRMISNGRTACVAIERSIV